MVGKKGIGLKKCSKSFHWPILCHLFFGLAVFGLEGSGLFPAGGVARGVGLARVGIGISVLEHVFCCLGTRDGRL
jgi:hypothetical protein